MINNINLNEFADGALQEKFNIELEKVLSNLQDPNTAFKSTRELTIKIKFTTDEARDMSSVVIITTSKLASSKEAVTKLLIGTDGSGGYVASEYKHQVPGQQVMRINETEVVDTESGEVMENAITNIRSLYR